MGCDAYADENGEIEIMICSYDEPNNGLKKQWVYGCGFEPRERIIVDWVKGEQR